MKSKDKLNFLITAGPSREYIDPVRFISNASSGKMGYALAAAARAAGYEVTLISSCDNLRSPAGVKIIPVESAHEIFEAVRENFSECDCLVMAAAVADYTPVKIYRSKIKKSDADLIIRLKPTMDVLKWAGAHRKKQFIVGFAMEDGDLRKNAEKKLKEKKADMIIANSPAAIGADISTVQIKTADSQWLRLAPATKSALAKKIISLIKLSSSP